MKPKQPRSDSKSQAAWILKILAENLPDQILQEYFRELSPKQVRRLLQETAEFVHPAGKDIETSPLLQYAQKVNSREKEWHGKLKGDTLFLFTDGASRGNPGEAGAGIAILDELGNELVTTGQYLGQCTNNEAEYRALLLGLEKCGEFGHGRLKVHLDSELIVRQINGQYRVKHPNLVPLFQQTMKRLSDFASFSISHVRREKNTRADALANRAIDEHEK